MKLPLLTPRHARRTKRGLALLCALVLVSSNALAALGVCVAKAPAAPRSAPAASAADAPCPQHVADAAGNPTAGERLSASHCPQDDPSAQPRTADVPAWDCVAAPSSTPIDSAACVTVAARAADLDYVPPEPLYARLSRLLL